MPDVQPCKRCDRLALGRAPRYTAADQRHRSQRPAQMDQSIGLHRMDRRRAVERLSQFVAAAVDASDAGEQPFHHLVLDHVFPDDVYTAMMAAMPVGEDYRPMSGRSKGLDAADGTHTRVKIDLFPEYIRHLPPEKRNIWDIVGRALCSEPVKAAFVNRLAAPLERRFGARYARTGFYPIPILTRDIPGYFITPHPDTHWKGITVQLYLPRDASATHIGTIFHQRLPDGSLPKHSQMKFAPNTGYAFAVADDTWHSADPVGTEVKTRDSILLTYFVDRGLVRVLRNRGKRIGNFLLNELRYRTRR
jgi:hypothetical protein